MTLEEKIFYRKFGGCAAALGNERKPALVQFTGASGHAQQQVPSSAMGARREPVSALLELTKVLGFSVDEMLGTGDRRPAKRGSNPKVHQQPEQPEQPEQLSHLPRSQQRFVSQNLDAVVQQTRQSRPPVAVGIP